MLNDPLQTSAETGQDRFERILSQSAFQGLKAIFERVSHDRAMLCAEVERANGYEELLAKLGYKVTLTKQIHIQDCYSRLGEPGGIKAVLPYHDIPTHSSLPTLVNLNSTVTTTPKALAFFNGLLGDLKKKLTARP
jgi:hypothetical protein